MENEYYVERKNYFLLKDENLSISIQNLIYSSDMIRILFFSDQIKRY